MAEQKTEMIYTIPLREAFKKSAERRVPYASRLVRSYLKTHTKANEVKLGKHLNEKLWERGITRPPRKVRVKACMDGDVARAELMGYEYIDFIAKPKKESKGMKEKLIERLGPKALQKEAEEKLADGKAEGKADSKDEKHEIKEEPKVEEKK